MRDYVKVFTIVYYDTSAEPGAPRFMNFFQTADEAMAYFQAQLQFFPNYVLQLANFRWYGLNKAGLITMLNSLYFLNANYQLFINGTGWKSKKEPGQAPDLPVFIASPRSSGFNSETEEP